MSLSNRQRNRALERAEGFLLLNMPAAGVAELDRLGTGEPDDTRWHLVRAECLRALDRFQEALDAYEQCGPARENSIGRLLGMAWCLKRLDRLPDAIQVTRQAATLHPHESLVLYNLSCYYALANDRENCLQWLGRALRADPRLRDQIPAESDFDSVRNDPDFRALTKPTT